MQLENIIALECNNLSEMIFDAKSIMAHVLSSFGSKNIALGCSLTQRYWTFCLVYVHVMIFPLREKH